jgi:hypothetical protein
MFVALGARAACLGDFLLANRGSEQMRPDRCSPR